MGTRTEFGWKHIVNVLWVVDDLYCNFKRIKWERLWNPTGLHEVTLSKILPWAWVWDKNKRTLFSCPPSLEPYVRVRKNNGKVSKLKQSITPETKELVKFVVFCSLGQISHPTLPKKYLLNKICRIRMNSTITLTQQLCPIIMFHEKIKNTSVWTH